jgi:hypothetical protein
MLKQLLMGLFFIQSIGFATGSPPQKMEFLFGFDGHSQSATLDPLDLTQFEKYMCLPAFPNRNFLGMIYKGPKVILTLGEQKYELAPKIEIPWPDYVGSIHHEFYYFEEQTECPTGSIPYYYENITKMVLAFRNVNFPGAYVLLEVNPKSGIVYLKSALGKQDVVAYGKIVQ